MGISTNLNIKTLIQDLNSDYPSLFPMMTNRNRFSVIHTLAELVESVTYKGAIIMV